jgi:hypothetical protein
MKFSAKLKTLQLERLESRELLASYVANWQPSEVDTADYYVRTGISHSETSIAKADASASQGNLRGPKPGFGDSKESLPLWRSSHVEIPGVSTSGSSHVLQPMRQIYIFFSYRTSSSNPLSLIDHPIVESLGSSDHFFGETESFRHGQESVAEGEGYGLDRPTQLLEPVTTHTSSFARDRSGDADKGAPIAPGNFQTVPNSEVASAEDETRINERFASKNADFGPKSNERKVGDMFSSDLSAGRFRYASGAAVDGVFAELFGYPTKKVGDISGERFSSGNNHGTEVDLNWRYILPSVVQGNVSESEIKPAAAASIFGVYDVGANSIRGCEYSSVHRDSALAWGVDNDGVSTEPSVDSSNVNYRNWTIGIVLASVWFSVRSHRRQISVGFCRWLKRPHLSRYLKKTSDRE